MYYNYYLESEMPNDSIVTDPAMIIKVEKGLESFVDTLSLVGDGEV